MSTSTQGHSKNGNFPVCNVTGREIPASRMLRLVVAPDKHVVVDLKQTLPATAYWVITNREALASLKPKILQEHPDSQWPVELEERIEILLKKQLIETIHLARRTGAVIGGFEKARVALEKGTIAVLLQAQDASVDGKRKLSNLAGHYKNVVLSEVLTRTEMESITNKENQTHIVIKKGGLADKIGAIIWQMEAYRMPMTELLEQAVNEK